MPITIRRAVAADATECGRIIYDAFGAIDDQHNFPRHVPSAEFATDVASMFAHAVGETNEDLKALIGAAPTFAGPGFLLPTRNYDVFSWCLQRGLRLVTQQTLMTIGLYNEPAGAWLPGILY